MQIEIKCLECGKRTRYFEIGPAAYTMEGGDEIILRDKIFCPKCKKEINNGKCVALSGELMISLMALTIGMIGEKEGNFEIPPHLRRMALVSKENFNKLKEQSKRAITLVTKF